MAANIKAGKRHSTAFTHPSEQQRDIRMTVKMKCSVA